MFTCNSTKLTSVPIIAYNSNVHFVRNDPFSHLQSHMATEFVCLACLLLCLSLFGGTLKKILIVLDLRHTGGDFGRRFSMYHHSKSRYT